MTATATVTVRLEIKVNDTWGDDCTVGQVKKQAIDSANSIIIKAVKTSPNIKVLGAADCTSIHYTPK